MIVLPVMASTVTQPGGRTSSWAHVIREMVQSNQRQIGADDRSTQDRGHDQALPGRDRRLLEAQALPDYTIQPEHNSLIPDEAGEAADGRSTQDRGHDQALESVIGDCSRPRPSPITRSSQSTTNSLIPDEAAEGPGVHRVPYRAEEAANDLNSQDRGHDQALPERDRRLLEAQATRSSHSTTR